MTSAQPPRSSPLAEVRARHALRWSGVDHEQSLEPATSATNQVWLTPQHVVRVSTGLTARLSREATLAAVLPSEVPYPEIVAHGTGPGDDWLVLRRVPGSPLAHLWPDLDEATRRRAIHDLATALRHVHATVAPEPLPPLDRPPHLLRPGPDPIDPLRGGLEQAAGLAHVDAGLLHELSGLVDLWGTALTHLDATTLVHGDLTFENVLHDGRDVTALLDLEWARAGPPDLDLDILLRTCAHPELHVGPEHADRALAADYRDVPGWLAEDHPALFAAPRLGDRLHLYAVAFDLREVLEDPPQGPAPELDPRHALRRLIRLASGRSHLDDDWVRQVVTNGDGPPPGARR